MSQPPPNPTLTPTRHGATLPEPNSAAPSTAFILATTKSNIDHATDLSIKGMISEVIGAAPSYSTVPSEALRKLKDLPGHSAIVVFSDQLTSSLDAPILCSHRGQQRFLSVVEVILNNLHGYHLHIENIESSFSLPPESPPVSVLRAISDHLDTSQEIESGWIARELQVKRRPDNRLRESRIRQRTFLSAALHMSRKYPECDPMRFDEVFRQLKDLSSTLKHPRDIGNAQSPGN